MIDLPPPDRDRSPRTGWTRNHWATLADGMLLALRPYASADQANIRLPGRTSAFGVASDALEAFARSFLLVAFRIAGEGGTDPHGFLDRYRAGLLAGTDPANPERWPRPDELGQAKVEAASLAVGIQLTRPWLWDRLDRPERDRVLAWLGTVVGEEYPPINWVWFQIVVETLLAAEGAPFDRGDVERGLAIHESLARAGGWYSDGTERAFDHYNGWAFHVYPLLWASMPGAASFGSEALAERWRVRLADFVDDAVHLTGGDGMPLLQGRSLIYRFASAASLWMGAITGATRASPGLLRRAASGTVTAFLRRGALDERGLLSVGLRGAWPRMAQSYSGSGSPYWASKGMLGLLLPADHPVWTAVEEPLPVERGDFVRRIEAPGWIAAGTVADGIVRVVNHGTDHANAGSMRTDAPLYARLGYSTTTFPPLLDDDEPGDQSVCALDDGAGSHRTGFVPAPVRALAAGSTATTHRITAVTPGPDHGAGHSGTAVAGAAITTWSIVRGPWEVRVVTGAEGHAIEVSGWAIADDTVPATSMAGGAVRSDGVASVLHPLIGGTTTRIRRQEGTSPLGQHVAVPIATGRAVGPLVLAVGLGRDLDVPPTVELTAQDVRVTWADGARSSLRPEGPRWPES